MQKTMGTVDLKLVHERKDPFYEIPYTSQLDAGLSILALEGREWVDYFNFEAIRLPVEIVTESCSFLERLYEAHPFICGIIRMQPYTFYDWHVDTNRGTCINMKLGYSNSYCMFENGNRINDLTGRFVTLDYKINTYYAFDNQVPHAIYNFDRERYLFTVEFEEDKTKLTFDNLVQEIKSW